MRYSGLVYRVGDVSSTVAGGHRYRFPDAAGIRFAESVPVKDEHGEHAPVIGTTNLEMRDASVTESGRPEVWAVIEFDDAHGIDMSKPAPHLSMEVDIDHGRIELLTDSAASLSWEATIAGVTDDQGVTDGTEVTITAIAVVAQGAMPGAMLRYAEFSNSNESKEDNSNMDESKIIDAIKAGFAGLKTPVTDGPAAPPLAPVAASFSASSGPYSEENRRALDTALRTGSDIRIVEAPRMAEFAAVTAADGAARSYADWSGGQTRNLWTFAGLPTENLEGEAVVSALTPPASSGPAADGATGQEVDGYAPVTPSGGRAHAWTDLSGISQLSRNEASLTRTHLTIVGKQIDKAVITALLANDVAATDVATAVLSAADVAAVDPSQVVVVGTPGDIAGLLGLPALTPASAADAAAAVTALHGARVYPTMQATAGSVTAFAAPAVSAFGSGYESAIVTDAKTGNRTFASWVHFFAGVNLIGGAQTATIV